MPTATFTEINFDVDEYLSKGGRLRDLALPSGTELKTIERLAKSEASGLREQNDREYFEAHIRPLLDSPVEFIGEISDAEKPAFFSVAIALLAPIDWPVVGEDNFKTAYLLRAQPPTRSSRWPCLQRNRCDQRQPLMKSL